MEALVKRSIPAGLILLLAPMLLALCLAGCSGRSAAQGGKPVVVATIFPNYDFVRQVAGDRVELRLLLPPGVEAHSYEPSPSDMARIGKAAMFVFTGEHMEPWAVDLVKGAGSRKLVVVDTSAGITLARGHGEHKEHDEDEETEGHEGDLDPHIWLDPTLAAGMVSTIADALVRIDPAGEEVYRKNAEAYRAKLLDLDGRITAGLQGVKRRMIVYGGHFAFGYFARRYHLDYVSPYRGFSPDSEPTPAAVAELLRTLKSTGSTTIFFEELLEPRVARVLAESSGAKLVLLHGAHNLSREEMDSGVTYLGIMEDNLQKLRVALGAP
jgi:zinc transport system substrate-binding protein